MIYPIHGDGDSSSYSAVNKGHVMEPRCLQGDKNVSGNKENGNKFSRPYTRVQK